MNIDLNKIDTSYWINGGKEFLEERKKNWENIEFMISIYKPYKKNRTPIKDYYIKGKMPNWKSFIEWESIERHLDIFMFLWLHPSNNEKVLKKLKDAYISSDLVTLADINVGYSYFLDSQIVITRSNYLSMKQVNFPYIEGKGELIFKLLMEDRVKEYFPVKEKNLLSENKIFEYPKTDLSEITTMGSWLKIEKMIPIHYDFLFQYDDALEWWYECVKGINYYNISDFNKKFIPYHKKALYRIFYFDTKKEGDTCRSKFVKKIIKILDEREFFPEFDQMWQDVKDGKTVVEDPWED